MKLSRHILLPVLAILCSCAVHTGTAPVGKDNTVYHASLGGPIIKVFGLNIPLPWLAGGATYGLRDDLDVSGSLHITPALYGVLILDPTVTWYPVMGSGKRPTVGLSAQLLTGMSIKSGINAADRIRTYPVLTPCVCWNDLPGKPYCGTHVTIPFTRPDFDPDAPFAIFSPFIGARIGLGKKIRLITELKYHAPNLRSDQLAVTYNAQESGGPGYGALSPLIGLEVDF